MLRIPSLLQGWRNNLRSGMEILHLFGASRAIKVEAGLVGIKGVMWPADMLSLYTSARKDQTIIDCQQQDWTDEAQLTFLSNAYNEIRDNFLFPHATPSDLKMILQEE